MPSKLPLMKLSREEEVFLRRWMYDEVHYQDRRGPAKQLQLEHGAIPADLAALIAAGIPSPADQQAAGITPPAEPPAWPWPECRLRTRVCEARTILADHARTRPQG
jgi:hypothetical protein